MSDRKLPACFFSVLALAMLALVPGSMHASSKGPRRLAVKAEDASSQPSITIEPSAPNFPLQAIGTNSFPLTITLTNFNSSAVSISSITLSGDYTQTNTCGSTVGAGTICYINVIFSPTAAGYRVGTLNVMDSASGSPQTAIISGIAAPAGLGFTVDEVTAASVPGNYTLTGTLAGNRSTGQPTGSLSFVDTSSNNAVLGTAALGAAKVGSGLANGPSNPTGIEPADIVVADFNGDGKPDLAILNDDFFGCPSASLSILLGNGDGTFTSAPSLTGAAYCADYLVEADFNGDGKPDLAVGQTLLLGNGDGTFTAQALPLSGATEVAATGIFNANGNADLVVLDVNESTATLLLGQGNGTFVSENLAAGCASIVGDFNRDGKADLACLVSAEVSGNNYPDLTFTVYLGNGDGTFQSPIHTALGNQIYPSAGNRVIAQGDFNGDSQPDIVLEGTVVQNGKTGTSDGYLVLSGKGDGTFNVGTPVSITPSPTYVFNGVTTGGSNSGSIVVSDFNGDGKPDIAVMNDDIVQIQLGNGNGTFTVATGVDSGAESDPDYLALAIGNFTGSGITDLAIINSDAQQATVEIDQRLVTETATLSNVSIMGTGPDNVEAVYAGDSQFSGSTSSPVALMGAPATATISPTSLTFTSEPEGSTSAPQKVTLTNTGKAGLAITSIAASGEFAETNTCGTALAAGANCVISVTFSPTAVGSGTGMLTINDNASSSPQTVSLTGMGPTVAVSPSSSSLTVSSTGGSATDSIQITTPDGFSGTVSLTCAVKFLGQGTAANAPTCSLSPSQASITGGAAASTTLTVTTTAASASIRFPEELRKAGEVLAAMLIFIWVPRRRWRGIATLVVLSILAVGGIIGCGSSSGGGNNAPANPGTTAGSYSITVTATSGSSTSSTTIPLSVE